MWESPGKQGSMGIPTQSLSHTEMHAGFHVKCQLLSDFNQNLHIATNFSKTPQYQIL
jgi:hypothetical protein